jgi:hypothetical protein
VDAFLFDTGTDRYRVFEGDRRSKEWRAFKEAQQGKIIFAPDEWNSAFDCAQALKKHPAVKRVLATGEAQFSIQWQDEETGLQCAGRPDFVSSVTGCVYDLKTTSGGLGLKQLASTVDRWGYHIQNSLYVRGLRANAIDIGGAGWIFVENEPPFDCRVVEMVPDQLAAAERDAMRLMRRVAECERTGVWPGVSSEIEFLSLNHWTFEPEDHGQGYARAQYWVLALDGDDPVERVRPSGARWRPNPRPPCRLDSVPRSYPGRD